MRKMILTAAAVALATTFASAASAQVTSYTLFGAPGNQAFTPADPAPTGVTGLDLTRGAGINPSGASNSISSNGWDDFAADDYYSFGFTVSAGYSVNLSTFWVGSRSSSSGPGSIGLFYNGDGFTTALATWAQSGTSFSNNIIDLSALTGLTGTVEFRIIALAGPSAGGGSPSSGGTFRLGDHFDNGNFTKMRFEGSVIPTPGALALFGVAGLAGVRRRR